jgi:hypothetical protein
MSNFQHYNEIVKLISREVLDELSAGEKLKLRSWVEESEDNRNLYTRLRNSANLKTRNAEYQKINAVTGWEIISDLIDKRQNIIFLKKLIKYAAAILLPLLIAAGIYFSGKNTTKNEYLANSKVIHPGSTKAVLILNDGKTLALDSINNISINEIDGTIIKKEGATLNYVSLINNEISRPIYNTINVPRGGEYSLVLEDGTRVYLNAMSNLKYPVKFSGETREVELSGEALFEVTKDTQRPFIVKTSEINIEVLGTIFNLNAYENTKRVITTLVEGSVKINSLKTNQSRLLAPDEQATSNLLNGQTSIIKVDASLYTAWKNGNLTFYDSRLEDIMTTLTRWYSANVQYMNESVKDLRFSCNLNRYGDINQILDILESTGKINIEIEKNTILFSERN